MLIFALFSPPFRRHYDVCRLSAYADVAVSPIAAADAADAAAACTFLPATLSIIDDDHTHFFLCFMLPPLFHFSLSCLLITLRRSIIDAAAEMPLSLIAAIIFAAIC